MRASCWFLASIFYFKDGEDISSETSMIFSGIQGVMFLKIRLFKELNKMREEEGGNSRYEQNERRKEGNKNPVYYHTPWH
jgi:hypothetical protein